MTLAFMTHFPAGLKGIGGKETDFVAKIWASLLSKSLLKENDEKFPFYEKCITKGLFPKDITLLFDINKKHHTIRTDPHNRWKPGTKIHMVLYNRTAKRFQFVPVLEVKSVQQIEIEHLNDGWKKILIDGKTIDTDTLINLAHNDGFYSTNDFFAYFHEDFKGKIIHWTDLKY